MSKRNTSLLDFFKKIPNDHETTTNVLVSVPTEAVDDVNEPTNLDEFETNISSDLIEVKSRKNQRTESKAIEKENYNSNNSPNPKKYKRLRQCSDDEVDDNEVNEVTLKKTKKSKPSPPVLQEIPDNTQFSDEIKAMAVSTPKKSKIQSNDKKSLHASTIARLSSFSRTANDSASELNNSSQFITNDDKEVGDSASHLTMHFLQKENIRDMNKRGCDHPDYDATTLFLPNDFTSKLTPGMKQWWTMKANGNMDTILFFKVGKFYELYHMDAVVAINELGLSNMRGNYAHSGFPEIAFAKMADQLVMKGYKVARVEQTETVEAMAERLKHQATKVKVVNREICQVITPGTRGFSLRNKTCREVGQEGSEEMGYIEDASGLLYAFKETSLESGTKCGSRYTTEIGVAVINTNTGKFTIAQFTDDDQRSRFRTMISRFVPNEIVYLKGNLSKNSQHVFNSCLAATKKECLTNTKQFLSSDDTLARLLENNYFTETPLDRLSQFGLPVGLNEAISESDNLGRTAAAGYELAVSCVGALLHCLEKCLIDKYLVSVADFNIYSPIDGGEATAPATTSHDIFYNNQLNMILDSSTLTSLDILKNYATGGIEGSLLERLDFSSTSFGRRLLIQWIASPLCNPTMIIERQEAIKALIDMDSEFGPIKSALKALPDLEKLIAKIHVLGLSKSISGHPDSRAVLFDGLLYSRRKINDFISALNAFESIIKMQSKFAELMVNKDIGSVLLKKIMLYSSQDESGEFPDIRETVELFSTAFDKEKAKKDGKIIPSRGVDLDYDKAIDYVEEIDSDLNDYLEEQKKSMKCNITYFGTGRNRYQLEIAESKCSKIPNNYVASSQRKGYKRYRSAEIEGFLAKLVSAEEKRDVALGNIMTNMFSKFDHHYRQWSKVISYIAQLDALISLATFSRGLDGGEMIRPEIRHVLPNIKPFLVITEGRYPCKAKTQTGEFISNTIKLGSPVSNNPVSMEKPVMLLTGPNMGGKSTLMRQTALIVILSQLGCYVPAGGAVILTPVDRLFTRQGANDAIGSGQSTLQVEMNEAALILSYMSEHSLLLIDELGRGTATYDGCALAYSMLKGITDQFQPRTIFSTHFHKLLEERNVMATTQISHMACMVEDDEDTSVISDAHLRLQNITFLYKLTSGGCPKSYGFNAARLANIPEQIILDGMKKARLFEEETLILEFIKGLDEDGVTVDSLNLLQQRFRKMYNNC